MSPPTSKRSVALRPGEDEALGGVLEWLAELTSRVPGCAVTGGLAVALLTGRVYRSHGDIDLGLAEPDLPELRRWLESAGYQMLAATVMVRLWGGRSLYVLRPVSVANSARRRHRHLRFMRRGVGPWLGQTSLMDRLDVFVHRVDGESMVHPHKGVSVPAALAQLATATSPKGQPVRVFSADYLYWIKCRKGTPKDIDDLRRLWAHGFVPPPAAQRRLGPLPPPAPSLVPGLGIEPAVTEPVA